MLIDPPQGTKYLIAEPDKLSFIWGKLSSTRGVFDDYLLRDPKNFFDLFMSKDTIWLERTDGNGILYLTQVVPGLSALAHIVYWDKRLRGRETFTMACLRWAILNAGLKKVNVWLPDFAGAAIHFAQKLGFKHEGKVRRWSYSDGKLYDILLYGMTNEEAFNGQFNDPVRTEEFGSERPVHSITDGPEPESEDSTGEGAEQPDVQRLAEPDQGDDTDSRVGLSEHGQSSGGQ